MDHSQLADRLRAVVKPSSTPVHRTAEPRRPYSAASLETALGGVWEASRSGPCLMIDRVVPGDDRHGRMRVEEWAATFASCMSRVPLLLDAPPRAPFLFFDLETTGLSGGAGTCAFLVGSGWFDDSGAFLTRQFLLVDQDGEPAMLQAVANELGRAGVLVSFNGKSFDAPLLETRYLFHRLEWTPKDLPHLDVLHPARRFWGGARRAAVDTRRESECSLAALESSVIGARRLNDVPGFQIPARYFHFLRSGDAQPLASVLNHNRVDLLTLACLTSWLLHLLDGGADRVRTTDEAVAVGRLYARAGHVSEARDAFHRALELGPVADGWFEALRLLAQLERRMRRFEEAARYWRRALEEPRCPAPLACEASEALAVHHEHRVRDLEGARAFATQSLDDSRPGWSRQVRHRLARLDRKLGQRGALLG